MKKISDQQQDVKINLNYFVARRPVLGYEIVQAIDIRRAEDEAYLCRQFPDDLHPRPPVKTAFIVERGGQDYEEYHNIMRDNPAAFDEFSRLDFNNDQDILDFTTKYGLLVGAERFDRTQNQHQMTDPFGTCRRADKLSLWKSQIWIMRQILTLYNCDVKNAENYFKWQGDQLSLLFKDTPEGSSDFLTVIDLNKNPEYKNIDKSKLGFWRKLAVFKQVDAKIKEFPAVPQLMLATETTGSGSFSIVFPPKALLVLVPSSLLSALWLQLFLYVDGARADGQSRLQYCPECGVVIPILTNRGFRARCPACTNRRAEAKAIIKGMHVKEGVPIDQIIQRIKRVPPETIREWVAEFDAEREAKK